MTWWTPIPSLASTKEEEKKLLTRVTGELSYTINFNICLMIFNITLLDVKTTKNRFCFHAADCQSIRFSTSLLQLTCHNNRRAVNVYFWVHPQSMSWGQTCLFMKSSFWQRPTFSFSPWKPQESLSFSSSSRFFLLRAEKLAPEVQNKKLT